MDLVHAALCGHFPIWKGIVNAERLLLVLEQRTLPSRKELAYFSSVSHRLFLMLYFLKTADSYVKYTKPVVNEP